jgi:O-acetyl-ADP-ribose deacetylase (regulator of RNase III)
MEIELLESDITTLAVDAIVNAADSRLQHGGGVAGAISRRGGPAIQQESDRVGYVPVGAAAATSAGDLPARWVIHAVGPRMGEGDEDAKLRSATVSALELAEELGARTIAFPAISTGIFGYPLDRCARIMTDAAIGFAPRARSLEKVTFCLFDAEAMREFAAALRRNSA